MLSPDTLAHVTSKIRDIPDFPTPGILFKDITPLLADPRAFHLVLDSIAERFIGAHVDAIVGVEARGFIFGGALAARLNASFVPARKPGKLPYKSQRVSYKTEYSTAELEMHVDSIPRGAKVVIVDDVCTTGGSTITAIEATREAGMVVVGVLCLIDREQGGRAAIEAVAGDAPFVALFTADEMRAAHLELQG